MKRTTLAEGAEQAQDSRNHSIAGHTLRALRLAMATTLMLLASLTLQPQTQSNAAYAPRFTSTPCKFTVSADLVQGKDVLCGDLVVPEDRTQPNGRSVKLAVAVFKSLALHPMPDPVIYLAGGPGSPIVDSLGPSITKVNEPDQVGNRDLILIDQRGTGLSRPSLDCPELREIFTPKGSTPAARLSSQIGFSVKQTRACHDRLARAGVKLDAYNTPANAADIADLRVALGLHTVNLYGGSYGSRLAIAVMRDHPEGIRSVVIDAVAHPQFNQFTDAIPNFWRSLRLVFTQCAKSPTCNTHYPHLSTIFDRLVTRLNANPFTLQGIRVDGGTLGMALMAALYMDSVIPVVPRLLTEMERGKYDTTLQVASAIARTSTDSFGMYLSMECGDDLAGAVNQDMNARARRLPKSLRPLMIASTYSSYVKECRAWQVKPVADVYQDPLVSTIPTLVMSSEFDPRTPPKNGLWVARTLSHGFAFTYPGLGHGARFHHSCPSTMAWSFINDPTQKPDSSCIAHMKHPFTLK